MFSKFYTALKNGLAKIFDLRFHSICLFGIQILVLGPSQAHLHALPAWGFWAHKRINRLAVYRLPAPMLGFYKKHIDYLTENAVNPDKRRYAVIGEAERHYIDLDVYGDSAANALPLHWSAAKAKWGEDSLRKHGIVPWYVQTAALQLTEAFKARDTKRILRISADLGHYIADAHVPLHTTENYNGQLTGQHGIHGLWESRLPELFALRYDLWSGAARYEDNVAAAIWAAVHASHAACDSVLSIEKSLTESFRQDKKYSYELRNNVLTRSYSEAFSAEYHKLLNNQVERRMRAAIKMVGDIWYSCWVDAGQPDLRSLAINTSAIPAETSEKETSKQLLNVRPEDDG